MFMAAWEASFKEKTILKAFEATGLSPLELETIHQLSIRLVLAEHENVRLKEALINERQRRKRGRALPLEAEGEYYGGAVFWSPRKVKEAQEQLQQQKAKAARLREEQRQEKLQAVKARRAARAAAQLMRQEEKARKRRRLKAPTNSGLKKSIATQRKGSSKALGAAAGPPPS
ncbi:hypothetical protein CC80DRAFT_518459 [Byssothecium circinans]|uniref:Uncharacterized protein n=1 Tax=Byssothecium circinans TaxID=147558 RepID=A0A6A5TL15_9PLEO|nr:hypothetical protein CC80DRAFT_518459 [Byssothecium circinans]